ncbi:DUF3052 family protein [Dinghuibacter silviterrae]|uniref:DUF3052 family protein n=1 Tax=Dinghuibacter silviterrae TaxID=1539049 RepID=A0A4R8DGR4_9BACT|nr:DUF3052 family protein [Dinghuibacter silviterrae]TDW96306.1 DUF3052 family protein [Dinghuibacter silviterrae]
MPAGYSNTPLLKKLGLKEGFQVRLFHPPAFYKALMPQEAPRDAIELDFIHLFTNARTELEELLPVCKKALAMNGMLWISWYKKAAGKPTELNETLVREAGLGIGLVDVKVCAVDEDWSGLKFVFRLKDRVS